MIPRWIRALARTWPVRPFPGPAPSRAAPRTFLGLEAVEDRTLASVSAVERPDPAPTEARTGPVPLPPSPSPTTSLTPDLPRPTSKFRTRARRS